MQPVKPIVNSKTFVRLILYFWLAAAMLCGTPTLGLAQDQAGNMPVPGSEDIDVPDNGTIPTQTLVDLYLPNAMLNQADSYVIELAGDAAQWNGPYMQPEADKFAEAAAEFLTIYPRAYLAADNQSVLSTLASDDLWQALEEIGITLMHPTAFQQAGQVVGLEIMPSIDGGFDRIALMPEPALGSIQDAQDLSMAAEQYGALIAGDIIPLHTGAGYDFRLAQMNYEGYPGIFNMIEIPEENWNLLPPVDDYWDYAIILKDEIQPLIDLGLVPGQFDVLLGQEESTDWSGWAATGPIMGVDGQERRWVYAHLFKPEQPALNWMDPTYNARIIQAGDIVQHVESYGNRVNRLDAVPFLGLEPSEDDDTIDVFTTPLAINGTEDLAFLHRKLGAWTWVELNVPTEEYNRYMQFGPDVGYDFFTRAQTVHPFINGDARILRVAHRSVLDAGLDYRRLLHDLQNHDEIAYQLINLSAQEEVEYGDETISGSELAERIQQEMREGVAGEAAPYNALYRPAEDGVATTFAAYIAPALGIDPYEATPEQVETIQQAHVMLAVVNAMQPGFFGISQWDLVGALPLDRSQVQDRIAEGDFRWLNRGAVDLMGVSEEDETAFGLPEAQTLYGPLPEQLGDPDSFASQVKNIIRARKEYNISQAEAVAAPDVESDAVFALLMRLPDEMGGVAVTAANYGQEPAEVSVDLAELVESPSEFQSEPRDIILEQSAGTLDGTMLTFTLDGLTGTTIVIDTPPDDDGDGDGDGDGGSGSGSGSAS
ncbi:MAG: hypothetical protein R6W92_12055 [Desulfocurvibacter africanus]